MYTRSHEIWDPWLNSSTNEDSVQVIATAQGYQNQNNKKQEEILPINFNNDLGKLHRETNSLIFQSPLKPFLPD